MVNIIYPKSWDEDSELDEELLMMDALMEESAHNNNLFWKIFDSIDSSIPELDKYDESYRGMKN